MYKSLETMGGVLPMTALLGGYTQKGYLSQASVTLYMKGLQDFGRKDKRTEWGTRTFSVKNGIQKGQRVGPYAEPSHRKCF